MPPADLLAALRKRPFEPFRIHLTDGKTYDVHHPELVMVGIGSAVIGLPADPAQTLYGVTETVNLRHIVRIAPLAGTPTS